MIIRSATTKDTFVIRRKTHSFQTLPILLYFHPLSETFFFFLVSGSVRYYNDTMNNKKLPAGIRCAGFDNSRKGNEELIYGTMDLVSQRF